MSLDYESSGFSGSLLAAMPAIRDTSFRGTVVLICAHSPDGAMGLVINRLANAKAVDQATPPSQDVVQTLARQMPIHAGGPAEPSRPFVLHAPDWMDGDETLAIDEHHALSATARALTRVAQGRAGARTLVALGYAGWGPGQLEAEVAANVWLTMPSNPRITFQQDVGSKWRAAVQSVGVEPEALSGAIGHA